MANFVESPIDEPDLTSLPRSVDHYRAYGCRDDIGSPAIAFITPDWAITSLPYARLRGHRFRPLGDASDCDGECEIVLMFGDLREGTDVVITGRNLYRLAWDLGERRVSWIRRAPTGRDAEALPFVRSIEFRERPQNRPFGRKPSHA